MDEPLSRAIPRPRPVPDRLSAEFWAGCNDRRLLVQRCAHCGRWSHPPEAVCGGCSSVSPSFRFEAVRGTGRIRTWTVMRDTFLPAFRAEVPYVVVIVELDEQPGLRMAARLVDGPGASFGIGSPAEVVFDDVSPDAVLPQFRLRSGGAT